MDTTPGWVYLITWLFGAAVFFFVLWLVVTSAVRIALEKHTVWLEERTASRDVSGNAE